MESRGGDDIPGTRRSAKRHVSEFTASQDGEQSGHERLASEQAGPGRLSGGGAKMRHNPRPVPFQIPRKNKEQRALFQYVSSESREFEDILTILSSNYRDAASDGTFVYTRPRLVHSELLEKDFVEKRKELKQDGRTEKELEEAHCFLLCDATKLLWTCEKGLLVGHSWITALGNPNKGVYLSKYSDLLQINPFNPGVTGEIVIFKVIKGRVKSIYENMSKNLLDPTPKFDSHFSKNASKVTSLTSFRSYELTQQYFYEYSFDELRARPRHACPYAVVSFQFKSKDAPLQTKPLAPIRSNSQTSEGSKGRSSYTVWSGDLVNGGRVHYQVCLQSFSPPFLPFKLPEKLELGWTMALDEVVQEMPPALFSWNLYASSHEVLKNGMYCSLLEVVEKAKSGDNLAALLDSLETHKVVLVNPLTDRGFLFLLSSVQMATPIERGDGWKRCLQALFVFPESRDVTKYTSRCLASQDPLPSESRDSVMPRLDCFVPALHHALVKVRCNPPADLSAGVERQALDYLSGLTDNKVRPYPMTEYDAKLDDRGRLFPAPKHHKLNMEGYVRSYLYSPTLYTVPVAKAKELMEAYCGLPDSTSPVSDWESTEKPAPEVLKPNGGSQPPEVPLRPASDPQRVQELINLVLTCKRNAEGDVRREGGRGKEGGGGGGLDARGLKRKMEQETAEKTLKYLKKASQERGEFRPAEEGQSPSSLSAVMHSVGLKDVDLRRDGSEAAVKLVKMLASLKNTARGSGEDRPGGRDVEEKTEAWLFERMVKLGLPTNCDIDLRKRPSEEEKRVQDKRDYLEEQTAGSMSSLEGFSPSSHSELPRGSVSLGDEEDGEIPWVLIPISGLKSGKYHQREKDNPHDPRFVQVPMATSYPSHPERSPTPPSERPRDTFLQEEQHLTPEPPGGIATRTEESVTSAPVEEIHFQREEEGGWEDLNLPPTPVAPDSPSIPESNSSYPSPEPAEDSPMEAQEEEEVAEVEKEIEKYVEAEELEVVDELEEEDGEKGEEEEEKDKAKETEEPPEELPECLPPPSSSPSPAPQPPPSSPSPSPAPQPPPRGVDRIVEDQLSDFSSEMLDLLRGESVHYSPPPRARPPPQTLVHPSLLPFSEYIAFYNSSIPLQSYVRSLRESLNMVLDAQEDQWNSSSATSAPPRSTTLNPAPPRNTALNSSSPHHTSLTSAPPHATLTASSSNGHAFVTNTMHSCTTTEAGEHPLLSHDPLSVYAYSPPSIPFPDSSTPHSPPSESLLASSSLGTAPYPAPPSAQLGLPQPSPASGPQGAAGSRFSISLSDPSSAVSEPVSEPIPGFSPGPGLSRASTPDPAASAVTPDPALTPDPAPAAPGPDMSSLISQLKPEMFSSLVEIIKDVQKNSVQFYIHTTEEENGIFNQIREYLQRLGNVECSPLTFLERESNMDKLLIIIQNKDIAAQIHKIPALVSLKRLPSVVFAGVDSVDDMKNQTYNELFVSGGVIVSDEFLLNPDFITHERLRALLMFLDQLNSAESVWRWKVHFKTQKKLKQQARFKREAMSILNVLTAFQKRQVVEFLPYHECDMACRQAPDLDCLVRLQGQHIQHRHTILLTECRFEMFSNYSSSGIVIAKIDDIMHNFNGLVGFHDIRDKQPFTDNPVTVKLTAGRQVQEEGPLESVEHSPVTEQSMPQTEEFCPPLDQLVPDSSLSSSLSSSDGGGVAGAGAPLEPNFEALRMAISQFKADKMARSKLEPEGGGGSPRAFAVNPHQTFFCPPSVAESPGGVGSLSSSLLSNQPPSISQQDDDHDLTPKQQVILSSLASIHSQRSLGGGGTGAATSSDSDMSLCSSLDGLSTILSPCRPDASSAASSASAVGDNRGTVEVQRGPATPSNTNDRDSALLSPERNTTTSTPVGGAVQATVNTGDEGNGPPTSESGLPLAIPVPTAAVGMTSTMAAMGRSSQTMMQRTGLLPSPSLNNNLYQFHSPLVNGVGGGPRPVLLLPNSMPLPLAWHGAGQAGVTCVWGIQPQGRGLMGNWNPNQATQGQRFRPHRGGYKGW